MKLSKILTPVFLLPAFFLLISCGKNYSPEEKKYIEDVEKIRNENNDYMKNDPNSPFNAKSKVHFEPLKYYEPDPEFKFQSKLYEFDKKDTVIIFGTKGEERKAVRYGYVKLNYKNDDFKVNVYEGTSRSGEKYFSIWFTDKTTGEENYGVGRYIDFELNTDKEFLYTIDFNLAYNPYCAYSSDYSCAIPTKEDYIDLAIEAGEKNFH
ncbi:MAG TPA: DUF1684 domain-containing protein [Ignavibacteriaceae bacterium]|nr:DUF1684 domain-containing protein [Ignavibacteriaceae bacterium]